MHDMIKLGKGRTQMPILETLHLTHVKDQVTRGALFVRTGKHNWTNHLLQGKREDDSRIQFHSFSRLEFQNGTRVDPTQSYHGSGRPDLHVLGFGNKNDYYKLDMARLLNASSDSDEDTER